MEQRTAIAFVNTNPTFNIPAPLPENVIPVGGLQIGETKPLPKVKLFFTLLLNYIKCRKYISKLYFSYNNNMYLEISLLGLGTIYYIGQ